jgi:hypothetical protein
MTERHCKWCGIRLPWWRWRNCRDCHFDLVFDRSSPTHRKNARYPSVTEKPCEKCGGTRRYTGNVGRAKNLPCPACMDHPTPENTAGLNKPGGPCDHTGFMTVDLNDPGNEHGVFGKSVCPRCSGMGTVLARSENTAGLTDGCPSVTDEP